MAKNYTFSEAVAIIAEGKDMESIQDIGRRYPIMATKVAVIATKAGQDFVELMSFMPEYLTANKVNTGIKKAVFGEGDGEEATDADDATTDAGDVDYESMSAKQLWEILGKAGLRKTAKSTKKPDLVAACKAMAAGAANDDADESDEEDANPYEGKSAMELFKECKKRGVKADAKKPAKYYVDLLTKADAAADDEGDGEDEGDWEEETKEEKKAPAKSAAKGKGTAKKNEKKAEPADDGDDWDI